MDEGAEAEERCGRRRHRHYGVTAMQIGEPMTRLAFSFSPHPIILLHVHTPPRSTFKMEEMLPQPTSL